MVDLYTRAVLTVIALALVALVMRPVLHAEPAAAMAGCGGFTDPCYVTARAGDALNVKIVTR
jgi:hypothetical protein